MCYDLAYCNTFFKYKKSLVLLFKSNTYFSIVIRIILTLRMLLICIIHKLYVYITHIIHELQVLFKYYSYL